MKTIQLTQGMVALVDDEDYEKLSEYKWYAAKNGKTFYAVRGFRFNGRVKRVQMHRDVVPATIGHLIDHIDGDGLNNQKSNLRECSSDQNGRNRKHNKNNTSGHKGVFWDPVSKIWYSRITANGVAINVGRHKTKEEAAKAYNDAAKKYHGEFARLNVLA